MKRPHQIHLRLLVGLVALLALVGAEARAQDRQAAVGPDGVVYMVRPGTLGDLLADDASLDADHHALALDLIHPDGPTTRLVVPGTESDDLDVDASVLYEDHSETLFVLWKTEINSIHSSLNLIGLVDGAWSEPIEISGNIFGRKIEPQFAITRDSFHVETDGGEVVTHERTVLHLIWLEPTETRPVVLYAPIILVDGRYIGWNPVYSLEELELGGAEAAGPWSFNDRLAESPTIGPGPDDGSVVVGFVAGSTGELVGARIEILPGELGHLADRVRAQIVDLGRDFYPGDLNTFADKVRAQIVDLGREVDLHPGLASYVSEQVGRNLEASDPDLPLASIGDKVRAQIVDLGSRMTDRGILRRRSSLPAPILRVDTGSPSEGEDAVPVLLQISVASHRPSPDTGGDESSIFLSRSGTHAVVAWEEEEAVLYRESGDGPEWGEVHVLRLNEELDREQAYQILTRRARSRSD